MLSALLLIPFLSGIACYFTASDRLRRQIPVAAALANLAVVGMIWARGGELPGGEWIGVDSLSLLFLVINGILFTASAVYAAGYLEQHRREYDANRWLSREAIFTGTLLVFLATMTLAIVSRHPGIFWMAIEATTLTSAPLISFQRSNRSLEAAWKYLLICSVGIALALIGVIALAVSADFSPALNNLPITFSMLIANAGALQPVWLKAAFVFILVGFGTKMGLAPLHNWLPDAHSEAPSPVSAILSGALLNCAFLGILRINTVLVHAGLGEFSNQLLLALGIFSMFLAGGFILMQADFKRLLAYSSVEHMGILAVALAAGTATHAGGMLHALNHSLTKGMLFLVAGNILAAFHTKSTRDISGLVRTMPLIGVLWIAGFLAICGVPPFGVFVSEFTILAGLAAGERWIVMALFLGALGIIFVGMARIVIPMAYGTPGESGPADGATRWWSAAPPLVLCILVLVLGLYIPPPLYRLIEASARVIGVN